MLGPLVTYPPPVSRAQIRPYLGVEHRIESIHIHIFTYQLQKEIRGHLRVGLGGGGGASGPPRPRSAGQRQKGEGMTKADAGLWAHSCSEWGTGNRSTKGTLQRAKSTQIGDRAPEHMVSVVATGTHERQDLRDRAAAYGARTWSCRRPCAHLGCPREPSMRSRGLTFAIWTTLGNSVRQEMGMTSWYVRHLVLGRKSQR